jgi:hypothetical protein
LRGALLIRDRQKHGACAVPGQQRIHFVLRCARDTLQYQTIVIPGTRGEWQAYLPSSILLRSPGPLCPHELQAHADAFHIAMTGRVRLGTTENEINPGDARVAHALPEQRGLKAATAK